MQRSLLMKKTKVVIATVAAIAAAVSLSGCVAPENENGVTGGDTGIFAPDENLPETLVLPEETPPSPEEKPVIPQPPKPKTVTYLNVTADGVNIRSGAGTNYSVKGAAEKSTMYALNGQTDGWYKTGYKNGSAYISSKYCKEIEMLASDDGRVEAVIAEGTKLLGTTYVYGATRYHDGNGKLLSGFKMSAFDCSSLMQYIFYKGAGVNLQLTTRTQIYQGKTVTKSQLKRGDLMFFTNETRKDNVGVERVGHVALFLGDNWILHTASDYAKIEQISSKRWSYFIQGQRIL